jgi:hypothetical protein
MWGEAKAKTAAKKMFSYPKGFHSLYASNWNVARDFLKIKDRNTLEMIKKAF